MIDVIIEKNNGYGQYLFLDHNETIFVYEEETARENEEETEEEIKEYESDENIDYYYLQNSIIVQLFLSISSYIKDRIVLRLFIFLNFH